MKVHQLYIHIRLPKSSEKWNQLNSLLKGHNHFPLMTTFNSGLTIYDVPHDFDFNQFQLNYPTLEHYLYCKKENALVFDNHPTIELPYRKLIGYYECSTWNGSRYYIHRENNGQNSIYVENSMYLWILSFYEWFKIVFGNLMEFNISNYPIINKSQINLSINYGTTDPYLITDLNPFRDIIHLFPYDCIKELLNIILTSKFENNDPFGKDLAWRTVIDRYYGDMFRNYLGTNVSENDGEQLLKDLKTLIR